MTRRNYYKSTKDYMKAHNYNHTYMKIRKHRENPYPCLHCLECDATWLCDVRHFNNLPFYGITYRTIMRVAHRFGWHYAPPVFPDGDIQLWCQYCGLRDSFDKEHHKFNRKTGLVELRIDVVEKEITKAVASQKQII